MAGPMHQLGALSLSPPKAHSPLRVKQDKPAYGVGGKGFYDDKDKFWNPGQALYFDGEPNLDLTPLNKVAFDKMTEFLDKLDALGERAAKKNGKAYTPIARLEWTEEGVLDDAPQPEQVLGARVEGHNEQIR